MSRRAMFNASAHCSSAWHMIPAYSVWCRRSTTPLKAGSWSIVRDRWCRRVSPQREKVETLIDALGLWWCFEGDENGISSHATGRMLWCLLLYPRWRYLPPRVKQSTSVSQYEKPAEVGKSPIKSTWMCRKRIADSVMSLNGVTVCRETLDHLESWPWRGLPFPLWHLSLFNNRILFVHYKKSAVSSRLKMSFRAFRVTIGFTFSRHFSV